MGYSKSQLAALIGAEKANEIFKREGISASSSSRQRRSKIDANIDNPNHPQFRLFHIVKCVAEKLNHVAEMDFRPIDTRRFRLDVAVPSLKLGFELDGYSYHGLSKKGFQSDRPRDRTIMQHGWRVYRFTAKEINTTYSEIYAEITTIISST